ncbi:winged helix-turn-helix domain-containing protein [Mesorhizobium sp. LHD-90]|uniref:helix-turn-helix domain-containing protein n=1 Tax=Mesorhizobium sp. LHD-90 TaxID=3071414 RepID=UPI0027E1CD81|nr:winged helix-turn-helix domain-containing protein [Mesorhizobium sp. LHD-90]MDQ6437672.1 winged helix-turn-helix domain-containing protein [Mesorhizobium sp. LHD-90]
MAKPLPMALRERVAAFVDEGHSNREASRHFRVSPKFVNDLMKLRRETGSLSPRRQGHGIGGGKLADHAAFVGRRMNETGELTLDELCVELEGRGVTVHRSSVARLLHRLGFSHKKRHSGRASTSAPTSGTTASFGWSGASPSSTRP